MGILLALAVAVTAPNSLEFRGVELGISLEEFKVRQPIVGVNYPICSDAVSGRWADTTPSRQRAGEVVCVYPLIQPGAMEGHLVNIWERKIPLSPQIRVAVRFVFYDRHLYRIVVHGNAADLKSVDRELQEKWGPPHLIEQLTQSTYIGPISGYYKSWDWGTNVILLRYPDGHNAGQFELSYNNSIAVKEVNEASRLIREADEIENKPSL